MKTEKKETLSRREVAGLAAAAAALAASPALANQPNMEAALQACRTARAHLESANNNKGGHRNKAIEHLNAAIEQIRKGIAFAS